MPSPRSRQIECIAMVTNSFLSISSSLSPLFIQLCPHLIGLTVCVHLIHNCCLPHLYWQNTPALRLTTCQSTHIFNVFSSTQQPYMKNSETLHCGLVILTLSSDRQSHWPVGGASCCSSQCRATVPGWGGAKLHTGSEGGAGVCTGRLRFVCITSD